MSLETNQIENLLRFPLLPFGMIQIALRRWQCLCIHMHTGPDHRLGTHGIDSDSDCKINTMRRSFFTVAANTRLASERLAPIRHGRLKSSLSSPMEDDAYHQDNKKLIPFLLADIGEGIAEVEVLQWFVQPGDEVKQFDKICQVQSDKANVEITSRFDGIIESLATNTDCSSGDMVRVGTPLVHLWVEHSNDTNNDHNGGTKVAPLHNVDLEQDKLHIPAFASSFQTPKVLATPAVRRLSMEYSLDLGNVVGSGPKGRVLKSDVLQMLQQSGRIDTPVNEDDERSPGSLVPGQPRVNPRLEETESTRTFSQHGRLDDETVPIRGYNRLMVKTMTESLSIPHMCYADEINMNEMLRARKSVAGIKLSILPFAVKAASLAMTDYPVLNSSLNLQEMTITYHANHNIGVAMDTPRGLAVPVVKACQELSILQISQELDRLKVAVRCFCAPCHDTPPFCTALHCTALLLGILKFAHTFFHGRQLEAILAKRTFLAPPLH